MTRYLVIVVVTVYLAQSWSLAATELALSWHVAPARTGGAR